tara:strand:- start:510 stop:1343 length:834 start_codon:yes stop_codon:yes gene_type:complete
MNFSTNKLSNILGMEIHDLDLKNIVEKSVKIELQKLFLDNSVLVVRNQNLNANQFQKSAEIFGTIFKQHNSRFSLKENPLVHYISNQDKFEDGKIYIPGEGFHTDHSNDIHPPKATILLAKEIPSFGGDTQFVNMNKLYEHLPQVLKSKIKNLKAEHVYQSKHSKRKLMSMKNDVNHNKKVVHPLIRTHPETGLKCLYINPIRIEKISNYNEQQTIDLLNELMELVKSKKFEYRHKWQVGDFVIWDNRILMHKANGDYDMNERRYLFRIMLKGDKPY